MRNAVMNRNELIEEISAYLDLMRPGMVDRKIFDTWSDEDLERFAPTLKPRSPYRFSCDAEPLPNGCAIVRLGGVFDDLDADAYYRDISRLLDDGSTTLILDCGYLTDISKRGIAMIVHTLRLTMDRRGRVVLSGLQGGVERKFSKLGFTQFFVIEGRSPRPVAEIPDLEALRRLDDAGMAGTED
jgi:anti-anti-sigma factor